MYACYRNLSDTQEAILLPRVYNREGGFGFGFTLAITRRGGTLHLLPCIRVFILTKVGMDESTVEVKLTEEDIPGAKLEEPMEVLFFEETITLRQVN